jgi:Flp pilus assembly CpaE family ATPase
VSTPRSPFGWAPLRQAAAVVIEVTVGSGRNGKNRCRRLRRVHDNNNKSLRRVICICRRRTRTHTLRSTSTFWSTFLCASCFEFEFRAPNMACVNDS